MSQVLNPQTINEPGIICSDIVTAFLSTSNVSFFFLLSFSFSLSLYLYDMKNYSEESILVWVKSEEITYSASKITSDNVLICPTFST